ncbi:YdaS antitoxin of YdaST toxin-antitoxin system [Breoghania corrubedonensis]|uniref:YdaS antitoxin of YdaST toxin-antitoxin system n=1 Tax=Breoghania corrubedonensis TaxID=665038 RepID=A0A2T5UQ02_9HYPH|nr:YdaS antitoxin of YdaST toxin-antitoxin system [Breoghania corrubedonensis]
MPTDRKRLVSAIENAIALCGGSQMALARRMNCSQQKISHLLRHAKSISAETALALESATEGAIRREHLRPDLFGAPSKRGVAK